MKDKKLTALVLADLAKKPKSDEATEDESAEGSSDGYVAAAEDAMAAFEAKDAQGLADALKSLVQMCMDSEG